jgi:hypothetical protein
MDLIVCGDALWISCGTWVAFWNGVIGASVAAAAGAVVALIVVRLTNAQQQQGVDRTVEVSAIGDFVASVSDLEWSLNYKNQEPAKFDSGLHILPMRAAVARLKMARPESRLIAEQIEWLPDRIHNLVILYQISLHRQLGHSPEILVSLSNICTSIGIALPLAVSRDAAQRDAGRLLLEEIDGKVAAAMDTFGKRLSEQNPDAPPKGKTLLAAVSTRGVFRPCRRRGRGRPGV